MKKFFILSLFLLSIISNTLYGENDYKSELSQGVEKFNLGKYQESLDNFEKAISLNRACAEAYYYRGKVYAIYNNYEMAYSDFSKAIIINPKYAEAYLERAKSYYEDDDLSYPITDLFTATILNPKLDEAFYYLALLKNDYEDYSGALEDINEAIKLRKDSASYYLLKGIIYENLKFYKRAITNYSIALDLNPGDLSLLNRRYILNRYIIFDDINAKMDSLSLIVFRTKYLENISEQAKAIMGQWEGFCTDTTLDNKIVYRYKAFFDKYDGFDSKGYFLQTDEKGNKCKTNFIYSIDIDGNITIEEQSIEDLESINDEINFSICTYFVSLCADNKQIKGKWFIDNSANGVIELIKK